MNPVTQALASEVRTTGTFAPRDRARISIPDALADQLKLDGLSFGPRLLMGLHTKAARSGRGLGPRGAKPMSARAIRRARPSGPVAPIVDSSVVSFAERARRRDSGKRQRAARKIHRGS